MRKLVSTSLPSTLPASAALARPAPIEAATSATVTGCSNGRWLPSGRVMLIMVGSLSRNAGNKKGRQASLSFDDGTWRGSAGEGGSAHVARSTAVSRRHPVALDVVKVAERPGPSQ